MYMGLNLLNLWLYGRMDIIFTKIIDTITKNIDGYWSRKNVSIISYSIKFKHIVFTNAMMHQSGSNT